MFSANTSQVSEDRLYVEDVFSTWLYTGNGSTQTITNGIDLAGKGGLVWVKNRGTSTDHLLYDTSRGTNKRLATNTTNGTGFEANQLNSFNSNGFTLGGDGATNAPNQNGGTYASWTFRKAPKFFDVVTYTGNGSSPRDIAHSLGVAPGAIIIKRTDASGDNWVVYHRSVDVTNSGGPNVLLLNLTNAVSGPNGTFAYTVPTATTFKVGSNANVSGATYVAYLFAHDTTSDGIIQCGSLTFPTGGSQVEVNLGWEPQWLLVKSADTTDNWYVFDNMRGMGASNVFRDLRANTTAAEADLGNATYPDNITSTGFSLNGGFFGVGTNTKFIYIAIRRGPMRTPTLGTSVFAPFAVAGNSATRTLNAGFPADLYMCKQRDNVYNTNSFLTYDRLRGKDALIETNLTAAEQSFGLGVNFDNNDGVVLTGGSGYTNASGATYLHYLFRRAPSFFDEVCYRGNGTDGRIIYHNLGVPPELILTKGRNNSWNWCVYHTALGAYSSNASRTLILNTNASIQNSGAYKTDSLTATQYQVSPDEKVNQNGYDVVAYLFASCPGVSKVGSYTGNGSSQTINCGFAAGARFVMIKRTDSTGDWWVWDTARGLTSANDPALRFNSTATDTTGIDSVDPDSSGFIVNQDATTNINVSSATYIYLAVA